MEEWFYGAILTEDPRDYKLGGTSIDIPTIKWRTHEYNQLEYSGKYGRNLCTLYAPIGMLSDLIGSEIPFREELCRLRTQMKDFDPSIGGYLVEGNNCVRNSWNRAHPNNQIRQFSIPTGSDQFFEALEKGHRLNIGYSGNSAYNLDASDGVLDSANIGKTTYGHSTTTKMIDGEFIVDTYKWVKSHNTYKIADFKAFISSGIVFPTSYLYLFAREQIDAEIQLLKEKHKDSGVIFNEEKMKEYKDALSKRKNFYS